MKNLFLFLITLTLFSGCSYGPSDDYEVTSTSVIAVDSINYSVSVSGISYNTHSLNPSLPTWAVSGTEMTRISELDTCLQMVCTEVLVSHIYHDIYFYTFVSLDGKCSVSIMNSRVSNFNAGDKINLFTIRNSLKMNKKI